MKRGALVVALVFSVGLNLGLALHFLAPASNESLQVERSVEERGAEPTPGVGQGSGGQGSVAQRPGGRQGIGVGGSGLPGRRPMGIRQMADALGLEGERRRAFQTLKRGFFERTREQREEVSSLQRALRAALAEEPPDRTRVAELVEQLGQAHGELEGLFAEHFLATLDLLEPDERGVYRDQVLEQLLRGAQDRGTAGFAEERARRREERMRRRVGGPPPRPEGDPRD